jgi:2-dehydropantoate 2-reductase
MRVIVIGAGAIGGWLAATLARGGAEVGLVARGATLTHLEQTGLTLLEGDKRETLRLPAAERLQELPKADVVILAVKTYAFTDVVVQAAPALTSGTLFMTAMNGLPWWFLAGLQGPLENQSLESIDPGGKAAALLAGVRPAGAVVHVSARAESPGVIRIAAVDRLIVGEPGGKASRELSALGEIVNAGSARCDVVPDIRREIWAKLWGNMNMNPVSALTRRTANGILGDTHLLQLVRDMMTEFAAVGARIGLPLPMTVDERLVITRRLGDFRTSMLNDVEGGRPIEVEALLGSVVELADKLGEPIPATRTVYALARTLNPGAR